MFSERKLHSHSLWEELGAFCIWRLAPIITGCKKMKRQNAGRQELCHIGFLGLIKEFRLHSLRIENKDFIQRAEENFGGEGD